MRLVLPGSAIAFAAIAAGAGWGHINRSGVPGWIAIVGGVVLLDLVVYLQHVLFHPVTALAQFHAVPSRVPAGTAKRILEIYD